MKLFGKKTSIAAALLAALLAMTAYDTRWGPAPCEAAATGFPLKPKMFFGLSIGFEPWVKAAFPMASCEADLIAWMDRVGFEKQLSDSGTHRRLLEKGASFIPSFFLVEWSVDKGRRISKIDARADLLNFFLFNLP